MIVDVKAQAFSRLTGEPTGEPRVERIDTQENRLFERCVTILDVKAAYEAFWNDLNPGSEDVVFVQQITMVW